MRWEAHQASGFFGWTVHDKPDGQPDVQPRFAVTVDVDEALEHPQVCEVLHAWESVAPWIEQAPAFTGGVYDAWPAGLAQGLAICRHELQAVRDYLRIEERHAHG